MKVKVLGCHGGQAPGYDTTSYLINDRFLIDAGSICAALSVDKQKDLTDIVLTHSHLDHIKDICFLLENTFHKNRPPLTVYASPSVVETLKTHIFNDKVWPDFSKFSNQDGLPVLKFQEVSHKFSIGSVEITPFAVNHPAGALGYLVDDGEAQIVFTGDSGPTVKIWETANACKNLKAIFTEVSFPSRMETLAKASGHFTLKTLTEDLKHLDSTQIPIYVSHFKPLFLKELLDEFHSNAGQNLKTLHADDELQFL